VPFPSDMYCDLMSSGGMSAAAHGKQQENNTHVPGTTTPHTPPRHTSRVLEWSGGERVWATSRDQRGGEDQVYQASTAPCWPQRKPPASRHPHSYFGVFFFFFLMLHIHIHALSKMTSNYNPAARSLHKASLLPFSSLLPETETEFI